MSNAFIPDVIDIERKFFALAFWIWVWTLCQVQIEAPRSKYVFLRLKSAFISIIKAHFSSDSNNSLCPRVHMLVQLVYYILSKF